MASSWVTAPRCSSGTSMVTASYGSQSLPSMSRVRTWGLPTVSSKPSRRMVSTSTASCSSPRPCTSQRSGRSVGRTRRETLPTSSAVEPALDQPGGQLGAVPAGQRRGVDADRHRQDWLVDGDGRQGPGVDGVGQRLADGDVGQAGDGDDLARAGLVGLDPLVVLGDVQRARAWPARMVPSARHQATVWLRLTWPCWTRHRARRPR